MLWEIGYICSKLVVVKMYFKLTSVCILTQGVTLHTINTDRGMNYSPHLNYDTERNSSQLHSLESLRVVWWALCSGQDAGNRGDIKRGLA